MRSRSDMVTNNLLELSDDTYRVKKIESVEESQISFQIDDVTNPDTEKVVTPEMQVTK